MRGARVAMWGSMAGLAGRASALVSETAMLARFLVAAVMLVLGASAVQAQPYLEGTFTIDIYNGFGGGQETSPGVQALEDNPLINSEETYVGTVTYTGQLDFALTLPNGTVSSIADFLKSGTGTYTFEGEPNLNLELSSPPFDITTVFVISFDEDAISNLSIDHDDGIGLYVDNTRYTGVLDAAPTSEVTRVFPETIPAGAYRLIYVAANGNPSVLRVRGTPQAPTPDFVDFGCRIDLAQTSVAPEFQFTLPASSSEKFCPSDTSNLVKLGCSGTIPGYSAEGTITETTGVTCLVSGSQCGLAGVYTADVKSIVIDPSGNVTLSCEALPPG